MFQYLEGRITDVQPAYIVVDVHGVGYLVRAANPYQYEVGDQLVRVYVHQTISDTAQVLYGFATLDEKKLFEKLLAVSGIGAKSALAILANGDQAAIIRAIQDNDVKFLTHFPGVGKRPRSKLCLILKINWKTWVRLGYLPRSVSPKHQPQTIRSWRMPWQH